MIALNSKNGEVYIDNLIFSSTININDFKIRFSDCEIEELLKNNQWESFKINILKEYIIGIFFYDSSIRFVEIYVKRSVGNIDKHLNQIMGEIGGEKTYSWGRVELNNDIKAGYKSILIKYI